MNIIDDLLKKNPYEFSSSSKKNFFLPCLSKLIKHHKNKSKEYRKILDHFNYKYNSNSKIEDFPYIPVRIFKYFNLKSIRDNEVYRTLYSSGTTSDKVSKIILDKKNSKDQINILSKLTTNIIGSKRLPMLIIDKPINTNTKKIYSARMVGITGFSIFGKDLNFAFNENMEINFNVVNNFLYKYKNEKIIIFGFTSIIWDYFLHEFIKRKIKFDLSKSIIIHGGGWKKLVDRNVSTKIFKQKINDFLNINRIINYYGMVEQTGSIFFECNKGYFHTSNFTEILIRKNNLELCKFKENGLIQLISLIPSSYPGNSILTEDYGQIIGEDNCKCGLNGKYFKILGRIDTAELRGCSDVY